MTQKKFVTLQEVHNEAARVADLIRVSTFGLQAIYGIPRGGLYPALAVVDHLNWLRPNSATIVGDMEKADIFIDDIVDSGSTKMGLEPHIPFYALFDKQTDERFKGQWLVMPWEGSVDNSADDIAIRLLEFIGEDPTREGLLETPHRFLKAWAEWTSGYDQDPLAVLKVFEDGAKGVNEMVTIHNIPIHSHCEHHLAPIRGIAHVGYIPNGKIVGLSKIPRLVEIFMRRLQVQERLTNQIADALVEGLAPVGVGVIIRASHGCMETRGINIQGSVTTTSAMRGALLEEPAARNEFLTLCRQAENN